MRAVTWQGFEDVRVEDVPDPRIEQPTDAIVEVTSSAICGSDRHLYRPLAMFMEQGDILGHEPIGRVVEVGRDVPQLAPGDRVVVPFNIACGSCYIRWPGARPRSRRAGRPR
jgi:threonine dehydrogenase-like Zn-dependent dehydrogenase